jgi:outer membrane protein OmpA-like peptidoglycan-associated protein
MDNEFGEKDNKNQNNRLARATSVKNYLVQHGIPSKQIVAISPSDLEQPRRLAADRRAQVILQ